MGNTLTTKTYGIGEVLISVSAIGLVVFIMSIMTNALSASSYADSIAPSTTISRPL